MHNDCPRAEFSDNIFMWLLFLLTAANACLSNDLINSEYLRIPLGAFPVNIIDILILVGLLVTLVPKGESYFEAERIHPGALWAVGLFFLAVGGAFIGAMNNGANAREITTTARNLTEMPLLVYLGYRLTPRPQSAVTLCRILVCAGVAVALIISFSFGDQAQSLRTNVDIVFVRVVQYVSNYAGIASALLLFSVGSGAKPLARPWLAISLAAICFTGQFATLSRSDWLALVAGIAAAMAVMPKYRLSAKIGFTFVILPIMIVVLLGAIYVASALSGRDVKTRMVERFESILPGDREDGKDKAWDSRLPSTLEEVDIWIHSPIIGGGFGIQDVRTALDGLKGYRHNSWSGTLAESGLIGFSAMALLCFGQIVVGRRLIRDRLDRGTILMGGLGVITGVHYIVHGYCTMSFNQVRWGLPLALTFGAVMRCRAMQLTVRQQYQGYLPDEAQATDASPLLDEFPIHAL